MPFRLWLMLLVNVLLQTNCLLSLQSIVYSGPTVFKLKNMPLHVDVVCFHA